MRDERGEKREARDENLNHAFGETREKRRKKQDV